MTRECSHTVEVRVLAALVSIIAVLALLIACPALAQQVGTGQPSAKSSIGSSPADQARILGSYGNLPLSFEANDGQADAQVKFLSRTSGYSLFLTGDEAVLSFRGSKPEAKKAKIAGTDHALRPGSTASKGGVLRMKLRNANPAAKAAGVDELPGTNNYFIGKDPSKWRTNVPTYARVKYEEIYSGIDLVYYGKQRQLEYDFIVAPGADPRRIAFDLRGANRIRRDGGGDLVLKIGEGEIRWHKPVAYQEKNGTRQEVAARYAVTDKNRVEFVVGQYDPNRTLYIDPLIYSTYLGGNGYDAGKSIAVDSAGNAYVTGSTESSNFPVTPGAFQKTDRGWRFPTNAFITKLNPSGSALVYSTYLGGSGSNSGGDQGNGIAVDSRGNGYITGFTNSADFPITPGAFQTTFPDGLFGNAFVTEIDPTGSALVYSTFLGGGGANGIAVDGAGNAYITGTTESSNFPITPGAFQTTFNGSDAFVTKLNPAGSALVYSTFLGADIFRGPGNIGSGIAVDSVGYVYVTGTTSSAMFPTTPGAFQTALGAGSGSNAFVTKVNTGGTALVYSTYLGGTGFATNDAGSAIAVDSAGNAFVTGQANSTDFPVTPGAFQTTLGGDSNAFVTKLNPTGSALVYSTYLGGNPSDGGNGIAVDSMGNAYVTGATTSASFPTTPGALQTTFGVSTSDAFVTKLNPAGSALVYSTYLGGGTVFFETQGGAAIAIDTAGSVFVTGSTEARDFPTEHPLQPFLTGSFNAFVTKISPEPSDITLSPLHLHLGSRPVGFASAPQASTLINAGSDAFAITSIGVIGVNSRDFSQTNDCGTSVPPNTSCSITVTFIPKATGNRSAFVSIAAPDSPQSLSVTGFGQFATSTVISSSLNPSLYRQPVTFTATVSSSGGTPRPGEYVTFFQNSTSLGIAFLNSGVATLTTPLLYAGLRTITAVYAGDANFAPSTSPGLRQAVDTQNQSATAAALASSLNPSIYGQQVTFTATITSSGATTPTGSVNFIGGNNSIGSAPLNATGVATLTRRNLNVSTYPLTAVYLGDTNSGPSASPIVNQVVKETTSAATVSASPNPSTQGQVVTFTATITSPTVTPTGPVTFTAGTTVLGTAQLSAHKATFTTSTLPVGSTAVKATYAGDSNIAGSSASVTETVQP